MVQSTIVTRGTSDSQRLLTDMETSCGFPCQPSARASGAL